MKNKTNSYVHFKLWITLLLLIATGSCSKDNITDPEPEPDGIYRIAVVVHVIHHGEPVGEGYNLSVERIERQIEILNEDFRRKEGTGGFNDHPDGTDTKIEFMLAKTSPDGQPTNGITRVNKDTVENPILYGDKFNHFAFYGYWDPELYINIWLDPLPEDLIDIVLGEATGPDTDLPGHELLLDGEPKMSEGIIINSYHFGESNKSADYNLGRTLTHEAGHYLGLLHLWGSGDCETNDYCDDTPPVKRNTIGCPSPPPLACNGQPAMIENYMDFTPDRCMNIFTIDQTERMHYVLENSPYRKTLLSSPGLKTPLPLSQKERGLTLSLY
ncbi:MAG: M43 family zinc metalloprotease [Ignavibacteriaceae bacterium]